ncbi:RadC family protein [Lacticaseibacillus daqingensis]|uniref:RadC family protein n=1 Tax=Lacticaseibacillus daqingensis TaxID=2486014 RepID=UPI000F7B58BC|nr:DNA repair protein RadC [Lacticaseibacillus daqingensis]
MQPREALQAHGARTLTDEALVRVLLGSGSATVPLTQTVRALADTYPQLVGLARVTVDDLMALPGIGLGKAALLCAAVEFGRRIQTRQVLRQGRILSSQALGTEMIARLAGEVQEVLVAVLLDVKNAVIAERVIARGGIDQSIADPRVVFREALLANAAKLILVHNHPSGDPAPSAADRTLTQRFADAGQLVGIALLDHLVVGGGRYFSFAAAGKI